MISATMDMNHQPACSRVVNRRYSIAENKNKKCFILSQAFERKRTSFVIYRINLSESYSWSNNPYNLRFFLFLCFLLSFKLDMYKLTRQIKVIPPTLQISLCHKAKCSVLYMATLMSALSSCINSIYSSLPSVHSNKPSGDSSPGATSLASSQRR